MYNTDTETREREMYLERRKREMEIDINRKFERMESEYKTRVHNTDNTTWEKISSSSFTEVFCCVVVVLGAAHLVGLI